MKFLSVLKKFQRDEKGVTLVEYGIAISLAVVLGVGALSILADDVGDSMSYAGTKLIQDDAGAAAASALGD